MSKAKSRRALITGIAGQDGSYMAELLLEEGYEVFGLDVIAASSATSRIDHLKDDVTLVPANLTDQHSIDQALQEIRPSEVYNFAAESFVPKSWDEPASTGDVTALGVARILKSIRESDRSIRFCQASTSEMFGEATEGPQTEETPVRPRNPYGAAKAYAHWLVGNYRKNYGMFSVSGILYNHESPRRGTQFVTRKVTAAVARIQLGLESELALGSLDARKDWGFAGDYVRALWLMMQQGEARDYVIATGKIHSVRDVCEAAFGHVGLDWKDYVRFEAEENRPAEAHVLVGDSSRAARDLGWHPSVTFEELIEMMVDADLERVRAEGVS